MANQQRPNPFDKSQRAQDLGSQQASAEVHIRDDVDSGPRSHHHTLGPGRNQAAPGKDTADAIDELFAFRDGDAAIGDVKMWYGVSGSQAPNWLVMDGSTFDPVVFPLLNTFLGGNTLPDFRDRMPVGASGTKALGSVGGAATVTLGATDIAHTHVINNQADHNHSITNHPGHTHGIDAQDLVQTTNNNTAVGGTANRVATLSGAVLGNHAHGGATNNGGAHDHGSNTGNAGAHSHGGATAGVTIGAPTAFSVLNPYRALHFLIRAAI